MNIKITNSFKKITTPFLLLLVLVACVSVLSKNLWQKENVLGQAVKNNPVKIAVCPTFYNAVAESDKIISIKTSSTAESLTLLAKGEVDYVLAGRILKPQEPTFPFEIIGSGYSFLSSEEKIIDEQELAGTPVYTDLDIQEVKQVFNLNYLEQVDNAYDYLDKGVVVTSWENTDYARAEIVHLFDKEGKRNLNSRLPIVYCAGVCEEKVVVFLKNALKSM